MTPDQAVAAWPWAINDSGLVVGTYRLDQGSSDVLHAYMIHEDGTGFEDIHPGGFDSSAAVEVTSSGMVIGHANKGAVRYVVIFPVNGYPLADLGENYYSPGLSAGCDRFVVLSGATELGGERLHVLYRVEEETTEILSLPDVSPGYVTIGSVADDGMVVGWYYYGREYGAFGYKLGNDHAWVINGNIRRGDRAYNQFRFCDFTSDGIIVGMVFRSTESFPQVRAAKYVFGVLDVEDVTPGEYSAFSELYSVNEDGWAVGYAGYSFGNENGEFMGVSDRAIAVKVK